MNGVIDRLRYALVSLPRSGKRAVMLVSDAGVAAVALWAAFVLRLGEPLPDELRSNAWVIPVTVVVSIAVWYAMGLYHSVVRLMGARTVSSVVGAATVSVAVYIALVALVRLEGIPRSSYALYWLVLVVGLGGVRYEARAMLPLPGAEGGDRRAVLIYGAGAAGVQLADALQHSCEYYPAAFLDDSKSLQGARINALPIEAPQRAAELIARHQASEILLALPSASRQRRREIIDSLADLPLHVRTVPALGDIVSGRSRVDELQDVEIGDLLGREALAPDENRVAAGIAGRNLLVTGAGGSIGSELGRQILRRAPRLVVLFERNESDLYRIELELSALVATRGLPTAIVPVLGSVLDVSQLTRTMQLYRVETVYHAAAYKHVPLVEANCAAGVRNNVLGTLYAVQAAVDVGVHNFVLVSTDKAVNPTNVMGASKRVAEQVLQSWAERGSGATRLSIVRFGNVLDSSGSVVPLFRRQIRDGGPVTVTHPRVTRYFMTIPEAAQLVLQAGFIGDSGDVFVLDMGQPVAILDLARRMIRLSGLTVRDEANPDGDIAIVFTGLRPGEKMHEELLMGDGVVEATDHSMIRRARESHLAWPELSERVEVLECHCRDNNDIALQRELAELVDGYTPFQSPPRQDVRTRILDGPGRLH